MMDPRRKSVAVRTNGCDQPAQTRRRAHPPPDAGSLLCEAGEGSADNLGLSVPPGSAAAQTSPPHQLKTPSAPALIADAKNPRKPALDAQAPHPVVAATAFLFPRAAHARGPNAPQMGADPRAGTAPGLEARGRNPRRPLSFSGAFRRAVSPLPESRRLTPRGPARAAPARSRRSPPITHGRRRPAQPRWHRPSPASAKPRHPRPRNPSAKTAPAYWDADTQAPRSPRHPPRVKAQAHTLHRRHPARWNRRFASAFRPRRKRAASMDPLLMNAERPPARCAAAAATAQTIPEQPFDTAAAARRVLHRRPITSCSPRHTTCVRGFCCNKRLPSLSVPVAPSNSVDLLREVWPQRTRRPQASSPQRTRTDVETHLLCAFFISTSTRGSRMIRQHRRSRRSWRFPDVEPPPRSTSPATAWCSHRPCRRAKHAGHLIMQARP